MAKTNTPKKSVKKTEPKTMKKSVKKDVQRKKLNIKNENEHKDLPHEQSCCKTKKQNDDSEALFIPAGVLTGMGFGFLLGNLPAGLFIGLGIGFFLFALFAIVNNKRK